MNMPRATVVRAIGGALLILSMALSNASAMAQVVDSDTIPVSVIIGAPGTPTETPEPTETPQATATATPGGGTSGGGNTVTGLPSTGAETEDGSDVIPALLVLAGGGLLAGSVFVGRRRAV